MGERQTEKVQVPIWMDRDKMDRFYQILGHRGAFPEFVRDCLDEFLEQWGDRPTPQELTKHAARRVIGGRV